VAAHLRAADSDEAMLIAGVIGVAAGLALHQRICPVVKRI
jgi:hypothetical protein